MALLAALILALVQREDVRLTKLADQLPGAALQSSKDRHRFPLSIIQHAVWLYHRFPLDCHDVQELLYQCAIEVSHETLREWCIKFGPLFAEDLRHREPRRGSRWHLDEIWTSVDGVRYWLWRAVDEHGFVLDILLQRHRDTDAAKTFLTRLLGEDDVPEVIHTDQLRSSGAAIRALPSLVDVDHQQVISTARCKNVMEQEQRSAKATRAISARIQTAETHSRVPQPARPSDNLHHHSRTSVTAATRRTHQNTAFQTWLTVAAGVV